MYAKSLGSKHKELTHLIIFIAITSLIVAVSQKAVSSLALARRDSPRKEVLQYQSKKMHRNYNTHFRIYRTDSRQ